jgi:phenylacetate-CoA ligase
MSKPTSAPLFHPVSAPDFLPLPQLRELQLQRLRAIVQRAYDRQALFRQRMEERQLTPKNVGGLADISKLPFTVKADLRDTYPFGLFASPMSEIVRLHASSGTTGKPIVVAYDASDIAVWTNAMVRCFAACGVHQGDIIQNAYGYGLFTGGLGAHYGAEALGATVIPISGGNTQRQLMLLKDFGATVICCTPSYFLHIIDQAAELGINLKELPLHSGVFGAEPWTESMRRRIEAESGIKAYDIYGLSEIVGPGVAMECQCQSGPHIFEDYFYPEIIDPKTGKVLADEEEGELVQAGHADDPLPHPRHHRADQRDLRVRPQPPAHQAHFAAQRRHVHHPRHQCLSVAD